MEQQARGLGSWLAERCQKEGLSLRQAATKIGLSHAEMEKLRAAAFRVDYINQR